jgi:hypothetical protein
VRYAKPKLWLLTITLGHIGDKKEGVGGVGQVFAEAGFESGPEVFNGIEVGGIGGQEKQLATRSGDQPLRRGRLMEPGVVQHDHAALRQFGQQHLLKIGIHHFGVATALEHQRGNQLAILGSRNNAGSFPPFARHGLINPLTPGGAAILTIQPVVHAALVEVINGLAGEFFQLAAEEPPLNFVALAVFYEFFLA